MFVVNYIDLEIARYISTSLLTKPLFHSPTQLRAFALGSYITMMVLSVELSCEGGFFVERATGRLSLRAMVLVL